ncbi:DUF292-domain-containing protein [Neoconidiobolus thromboides FSU 785]|nr:DUF292-domain-containing protein [Neoconidiobolus thromboides FSU 785]
MFSSARLKIHLKLSINRVKLLRAKKENLSLKLRKEISLLLADDKLESAKIRVENIIREDNYCEALEVLELFCELLLARFSLLELNGDLDPSLIEGVQSLIYCSARCGEIKELVMIRDQFAMKYGKEYVVKAMQDQDHLVNSNIIKKLDVTPPGEELIEKYLEEIGIRYNVSSYCQNGQSNQNDINETSLIDVENDNEVIPSPPVTKPKTKIEKNNLSPDVPKALSPTNNVVNNAVDTNNKSSSIPSLSELEARFQALKKGSNK